MTAHQFESLEVDAGFNLFPYGVVRITAGPFDELVRLDQPQSLRALAHLRDTQQRLDAAAALLRDETFAAIGGCEDATLRRLLLRAKRDLFNGRVLDEQTLAALESSASQRLAHLAGYARAARDATEAGAQYLGAFEYDAAATRDVLRELASREALHAPLALSSNALLEQVRRYVTRPQGRLTTKDRDVEQALMKYLTRMHTKTSPFSRFCHVALATFAPLRDARMSAHAAGEARSHVRLNQYVWLPLRELLLGVPAFVDHLHIRVNPTLTRAGDQMRFLINVRNVESIQRIAAPEALLQLLALADDAPLFRVLVDRILTTGVVSDERDGVREFVDGMLDNGLLELVIPVSGIDPDWDVAAISLLEPIANECAEAREAIEAIRTFRADAARFETATAVERAQLLARCTERLQAIRDRITAKRGTEQKLDLQQLTMSAVRNDLHIPEEKVLFEDSMLTGRIVFDDAEIAAMTDSLHHLDRSLAFNDPVRPQRRQALFFFEDRYGRNAVVPLVQFYEDFFRECKKAEYEAEQAGKPHDAVYPGVAKFRQLLDETRTAVERWTSALTSRLAPAANGRIYIDRDDIDFAFTALPELRERAPESIGAFVQLALDPDDGPIAIMNQNSLGHGKAISRFLHLLPPEVLEAQRRANLDCARGSRLAELRDASLSNTNLHPPLADAELSSPGAQTSCPPEQQIPVSEVVVRVGEDGELWLWRPSTRERIEVLDLGLQAVAIRSQLFRMLYGAFTRANHLGRQPLHRAAEMAWSRHHERAGERPGITVRPRTVYDRRIVIARQSWSIPKALLPVRENGESDAAFFARIDAWRTGAGIPLHVFASLPGERKNLRARDDYKPQYISFASWLSVALFEKLISRATDKLTLEEMLPGSPDMLAWNGRRHAIELILQWNRSDG